MKKILIIASGTIGEHFIQRVIDTYSSDNIYYVVQQKAKEFQNALPNRFKFFEFDPTSLYKLSNILKMDFLQIFIVLDNKTDVEYTLKNIKIINKSIQTIVIDQWGLRLKDTNVLLINSNDILASKLIDYLPNVPVIAQNVGLGEGEIMEVSVPFGSSFVYKHLGVIEQKNWKISAIYRNGKLLLPTRRRMIQPNDILLLIGEPFVLKSIYKVIKQELGQFPQPFGENLYLFIDMLTQSKETIKNILAQVSYIKEKFKKQLYIRVINPNDIDLLREIKELRDLNTTIIVKYDKIPIEEMLNADKKNLNIGVIIVTNKIFYDKNFREMLYKLQIPVLKISNKNLKDLKYTSLILSPNKDFEKISNTVFDFSAQLELNIELYDYTKDQYEEKEQLIEHYYNLSSIFSKNIKVYKQDENPIKILQKKDDFLHIVPFSRKITRKTIYSYFSTDSDLLYHYLDDFHQMFIPVDDI
jgi:hypothetical protein